MRPKILAGLLAVALIGYFILMARQAFAFIAAGGLGIALGLAVLVLPLLGCYVLVREWQFGVQMQRLAAELERRGDLPVDDLPKRPSGRAQRGAADARFEERAAEVERSPRDPGAWFRLAIAYDDAGDRKRARSAMRRAVALHRRQR